MLADPVRVDVALRVWRRLRRTDTAHPVWLARRPGWEDRMDGYERHQLLAMSEVDLLAFEAVVEAETLLLEALVEISTEPDMRAALEQHRPQRGEP